VLPFDCWSTFDAELGMTVGDALLLPHRSYLAEIQALIGAGAREFAHITGGGHPGNIDRILPEDLAAEIDTSAWEVPAIFRRITSGGAVPAEEMYRVFNMGIGLVAVVPVDRLDQATAAVPGAVVIGQIVPRDRDTSQVRLMGLGG
jgi:phosphoribosylformylglycinamidine cyclo-ligase